MPEPLKIPLQPWQHPRPKRLTLEHLPEEIQLRIFEFALVEPSRRTKTHVQGCHFKPADPWHTKMPPFLNVTVTVLTTDGWALKTDSHGCHCAKRKGLALLRANRHIYEAASRIFWSKNTFCFLDAVEVVAALGHIVPPRWRRLVRSISVLNPDDTGHAGHVLVGRTPWPWMPPPSRVSHSLAPFWEAVMKCEQLRELEVPPPYIRPAVFGPRRWARLARALPRLDAVRLSYLLPFSDYEYELNFGSNQWRYPNPRRLDLDEKHVFVRCSRTVSLRDANAVAEAGDKAYHHNLEFNFRIYVSTIVKTQFLGVRHNLEEYHNEFALRPGLSEDQPLHTVTLPTGEATTIEFFGLPSSKTTRIRELRQRQARDRQQKRRNGLTHAQNEAVEGAKAENKIRSDFEAQVERDVHDRQVVERGVRRIQLGTEERLAERDAERHRKTKVRQAEQARLESRKKERKRAGRSSP